MCNLCVCSSGIAAQGGTSDVIQVYQNGSSTLSVWVGDAPYDELHALRGVSMERNGLGRGQRSGVTTGWAKNVYKFVGEGEREREYVGPRGGGG